LFTGKKPSTLHWFDVLEIHPQLIDIISYNKLDTDILEDEETAPAYWQKLKSRFKRSGNMGATKKLISIPLSEINKMTKTQLAKQLARSEYSKVFTDATYNNLDKKFTQSNAKKTYRTKTTKIGMVIENQSAGSRKMMVKLSDLAYIYVSNIIPKGSTSNQFRKWCQDNAGKFVEVSTNFLFDNQYNAIAGYRIYDTQITAIKNDARVGKSEFKNNPECAFILWNGTKPPVIPFNDTTDAIAKVDTQWKNRTYVIGTYRLSVLNNEHYVLENGRQRIKFLVHNGDYYITNGIGYKQSKSISGRAVYYPVPDLVKKKVDKIFKVLGN
jgi:hypothetical protein